jgi:hypothetical protein
MRIQRLRLPITAALFMLVACNGPPADRAARPLSDSGGVVDSAVPMNVALARFRADLGAPPVGLGGGRSSREELLGGIVHALRTRDTAFFESIAMNRAEFAYLYYPTSSLARRPYELPPALAWMQIQATNRKSVIRSLGAFGGKDLCFLGYHCAPDPTLQGANRIWHDCLIVVRTGTDTLGARLIGGILERGGEFKVLSYATDR